MRRAAVAASGGWPVAVVAAVATAAARSRSARKPARRQRRWHSNWGGLVGWGIVVHCSRRSVAVGPSRSVVWNAVDWYGSSFKTTNELATQPAGRSEGSPHLLRG